MNILETIVAHKRMEVDLKKLVVPSKQLESYKQFERETFSLSEQLKESQTGIIAEHKRRSPSKAIINQNVDVSEVAASYERAGACGMSVLTDSMYFGGSLDDLVMARASCKLPLIRKEFVVDEYQIIEAKAHGADAILLIAAILIPSKIESYSILAKSLNLEVLLEVHDATELSTSTFPSVDMIGVNNRNLKTFEVDLNISKNLSDQIPNDFVKVSESGISTVEAIKELRLVGYEGFLIGENFMKTFDPGDSAFKFINQLQL